MVAVRSLGHVFVEAIPEHLDQGTLYVCIPVATAMHLCCCGCRGEVVTPITPTDWTLVFDGETVSLSPSIGNWSFACRSHYWIRRGRVVWSAGWSDRQIERGRAADARAKAATFADPERTRRPHRWATGTKKWLREVMGRGARPGTAGRPRRRSHDADRDG